MAAHGLGDAPPCRDAGRPPRRSLLRHERQLSARSQGGPNRRGPERLGDVCHIDDGDGTADEADCAPLDPDESELPGEVGPTLRWRGDRVTLDWDPIPQAKVHNVYRGAFGVGPGFDYDHTCFEGAVQDLFCRDDGEPTLGGWYYLVSGKNCFGEGTLGWGRPNAHPCP